MSFIKASKFIILCLFMASISASEMTVKLSKSFFPKKDIIIDADSPDRIIVEYDLMYSISDGCAADVVTVYKLGGCPFKKYKTIREDGKYIVEIDQSSARKGKGAQTLRLSIKQKKKDSYKTVPVVTILDGNEDKQELKKPFFGKKRVILKSRDHVVNEDQKNQKTQIGSKNDESTSGPKSNQQ